MSKLDLVDVKVPIKSELNDAIRLGVKELVSSKKNNSSKIMKTFVSSKRRGKK